MSTDAIIRWWEKKDDPTMTAIQIDHAEEYWLAAHTKKINDAWEVAIVRWRYKMPHLVALIRDGEQVMIDGTIA